MKYIAAEPQTEASKITLKLNWHLFKTVSIESEHYYHQLGQDFTLVFMAKDELTKLTELYIK